MTLLAFQGMPYFYRLPFPVSGISPVYSVRDVPGPYPLLMLIKCTPLPHLLAGLYSSKSLHPKDITEASRRGKVVFADLLRPRPYNCQQCSRHTSEDMMDYNSSETKALISDRRQIKRFYVNASAQITKWKG